MRERYYISFSLSKTAAQRIRKFFKKAGKEELLDRHGYYTFGYCGIYILADDPHLAYLKKAIKKFDREPLQRLERIYTSEELSSCKLLLLNVNRAPKGDGGPSYGTKFDMSKACKVCGTGAIQISELIMRESDIPKNRDLTQTYYYEIIVSKRVKDKFLKENIQGVELRPVISNKDKKEFGYYQLIPLYTLPRFSKSSRGVTTSKLQKQCNKCKLNGFYWDGEYPIELHYNNLDESIPKKADIFYTYEHFGISKIREPFTESKFAMPLYLVTPKIFKIFDELKVRGARFEPIIINGYPDLNKWKKLGMLIHPSTQTYHTVLKMANGN